MSFISKLHLRARLSVGKIHNAMLALVSGLACREKQVRGDIFGPSSRFESDQVQVGAGMYELTRSNRCCLTPHISWQPSRACEGIFSKHQLAPPDVAGLYLQPVLVCFPFIAR